MADVHSLWHAGLQEKRYAKTRPQDARVSNTDTGQHVALLSRLPFLLSADHGLYLQFNFFDITPYGVPYALFGMCYSLIFSKWLLVGGETRRHSDLLFVAQIPATSRAVGRSIANAGLQFMERVILTAVERDVSTKPAMTLAMGYA